MSTAPIQKTLLEHANLSVSRICFGTSSLGDMPGTYGYDVSEDRARATVRAIFSGPVNFLDTSRIYGFGRSEERIGDVIRERGGLPEGFVLSTKLDRDPETNRFDASQARRSLEESLKALGLDRLHLLHLHDPEHADTLEATTGAQGALPELFKMKEEGLVNAVGLAAGSVEIMMPLLRDWDFDAMITHNRFTLANRNAEAMISYAHSKGIAVLNAAPYAGGVLAKGSESYPRYVYQEASEEVLDPIRRIETICSKHGVPSGAVALQFSMRDERITSTICGVSKPERVAQTLEWARWPVPQAVWDDLASLSYSVDDPEASRQYNPA
ncbi:aldo/keto reductase [Microvirga sp. P5_D2]